MWASGWLRRIATAVITAAIVFIGVAVGAIALAPATSAQETQSGQPAFVNVDSLTFRQTPGLSGAVIAWLPYGTDVAVIDGPVSIDGYDWFQLTQNGSTGWSVEGFIRTSSGVDNFIQTDSAPSIETAAAPAIAQIPEARTILTVTAGFLEIRRNPSSSSGVTRIVTLGTQLTQTGTRVEIDGLVWYPVDDIGWVGGQRAGETGGLFPEQYPRYVTADVLNVRSSPGLSGPIVQTLSIGDAVNTFESTRDADGINWFAVDDAGTFWVAAEYLTISPPNGP